MSTPAQFPHTNSAGPLVRSSGNQAGPSCRVLQPVRWTYTLIRAHWYLHVIMYVTDDSTINNRRETIVWFKYVRNDPKLFKPLTTAAQMARRASTALESVLKCWNLVKILSVVCTPPLWNGRDQIGAPGLLRESWEKSALIWVAKKYPNSLVNLNINLSK